MCVNVQKNKAKEEEEGRAGRRGRGRWKSSGRQRGGGLRLGIEGR